MYTNGYGAPGTVEPVITAPSDVDVPVVVAEVGCGNMKPVDGASVPVVPVSVPVQLAPVGQQAILLAASRVHLVPSRQQTAEFPSAEQGSYPEGQLF